MKDVKEGESRELTRSDAAAVAGSGPRELYKLNWVIATDTVSHAPGRYLEAGQWLAITKGGPFVEDAMNGIRTRTGRSVVTSELRFGGAE